MNRDAWDFSFLEEVAEPYREEMRRAAALYEYARHNAPLKEWVELLRAENAFNAQPVRPEIKSRVVRENELLGFVELGVLVKTKVFPHESFRVAMEASNFGWFQKLGVGALANVRKTLTEVPWRNWSLFSESLYPGDPVDRIQDQHRGPTSAHPFVVHWEDTTNEELAQAFKLWAIKNRPVQFPERKRGGRGKGSAGPSLDRLNQLAAFRFDSAGHDWSRARDEGFKVYNSQKRWRGAVEAARVRVHELYQASEETLGARVVGQKLRGV